MLRNFISKLTIVSIVVLSLFCFILLNTRPETKVSSPEFTFNISESNEAPDDSKSDMIKTVGAIVLKIITLANEK